MTEAGKEGRGGGGGSKLPERSGKVIGGQAAIWNIRYADDTNLIGGNNKHSRPPKANKLRYESSQDLHHDCTTAVASMRQTEALDLVLSVKCTHHEHLKYLRIYGENLTMDIASDIIIFWQRPCIHGN